MSERPQIPTHHKSSPRIEAEWREAHALLNILNVPGSNQPLPDRLRALLLARPSWEPQEPAR
ncbi:MAG: hypothetical protein AAFQ82_26160 [Myxococcota bacterium]